MEDVKAQSKAREEALRVAMEKYTRPITKMPPVGIILDPLEVMAIVLLIEEVLAGSKSAFAQHGEVGSTIREAIRRMEFAGGPTSPLALMIRDWRAVSAQYPIPPRKTEPAPAVAEG
jgi:hypothetical protein